VQQQHRVDAGQSAVGDEAALLPMATTRSATMPRMQNVTSTSSDAR
jgi:hypothetical protein